MALRCTLKGNTPHYTRRNALREVHIHQKPHILCDKLEQDFITQGGFNVQRGDRKVFLELINSNKGARKINCLKGEGTIKYQLLTLQGQAKHSKKESHFLYIVK